MEKEAFEPTGLIPRSIIRTVDRFVQQLLPGREKIALQEYRVSRYQILVSIKSLLTLILIPLLLNSTIKALFFTPLIEYFWNSHQPEIFLNQYQEKRAFSEMHDFSEKMFFESLLIEPKARSREIPSTNYIKLDLQFSHTDMLTRARTNPPKGGVSTGLIRGTNVCCPDNALASPYKAELCMAIKSLICTQGFASLVHNVHDRMTYVQSQESIALLHARDASKMQSNTNPLLTHAYPCYKASHTNRRFVRMYAQPLPMLCIFDASRATKGVITKLRLQIGDLYALQSKALYGDQIEDLYVCTRTYGGVSTCNQRGVWVARTYVQIGDLIASGDAKRTNRRFVRNTGLVKRFVSASVFVSKSGLDVERYAYNNASTYKSMPLQSEALYGSDDFVIRICMRVQRDLKDRYKSRNPIALECKTYNNCNNSLSTFVNLDNDKYQRSFQIKSLELAKSYNKQSILAITNLLGDFLTFFIVSLLFRIMRPELIILKSFLTESVYSLSDTTKSFLLILGMDLLVGFHSPRGWELALEGFLKHIGLPENENFILLFVALFPVFLDTVFKYWIFRYLNKISPSTVVTYHSMIE